MLDLYKEPGLFKDGYLGLDLPDGTSFERAKEFANFLNDNIESVRYTRY